MRTDGLTAEDRSQRDHAGVLRSVKFREPSPGNLPYWSGQSCETERGAFRSAAGLLVGSTSRLIPLLGVSRLS